MGTVAALGGTPLALVYQDRSGPEMRSTLAVSFVVGILMSIAGPALAGQVEVRHVVLALELLPGLLAGLLISRWVVHRLEERRLHPAVLIFAAVAGVVITLLGSRAQAIRGAAYENDPGKAPARSVSCVRRVGRGPGDAPYRFSHLTACTMGRQYGPAGLRGGRNTCFEGKDSDGAVFAPGPEKPRSRGWTRRGATWAGGVWATNAPPSFAMIRTWKIGSN